MCLEFILKIVEKYEKSDALYISVFDFFVSIFILNPSHLQVKFIKNFRLEDERMEKKQTDSVQNRFTAYLMATVANRRISYMKQRNRQKERERGILFARVFGELNFLFYRAWKKIWHEA